MASLIIVGLNGTSAVITGVTAVLVARILGPRETGYLVWFITGTTTIAIFGDFLGIHYSNAYLLARNDTQLHQPTVRGTVLTYGLAAGLLAGIAVGYVPSVRQVAFAGFDGSSWSLLILMNVTGLVVLSQVRGLFWGRSAFISLGLVNLIRSSLYGVGLFVCLYFLGWRTGSQLAIAQVAGTGLCAVGFVVYLATRGISAPRFEYMKSCMHVGWRAAGVNWLSFLHVRVDQYMVTVILGPAALGLYSVAVSLGETFNYVPMMLGLVLFPIVAGGADPREAARKTIQRTLGVMTVVSLAMIPLAIAAAPVIRLFYGDQFEGSVQPLLYFIPAVIFLSGLPLLNSHISGLGYPVFQLVSMAVALLGNIVCNLILLPHFGPTGAAISSSLSYGLWFVLAGGYLLFQFLSHRREARSACAE